jgi:hypothetical protein
MFIVEKSSLYLAWSAGTHNVCESMIQKIGRLLIKEKEYNTLKEELSSVQSHHD